MKIGIMAAMEAEVNTVCDAMEITNTTTRADRIYYEGKYCSQEVVLVFSRWGKVAAASTAATLLERFNVDMIIFTGVAGAVSPDLNIGDVVIGNELYQHDMDCRPLIERFEIPLTGRKIFRPEASHLDAARESVTEYLADISRHIDSSVLTKFSITSPKVIIGTIASGDQFISDAKELDSLRFNPEGKTVHACEMEGAAVAQVCQEHQVPFMIFRTLSDKADHSASVDFMSFVNEVASHYSQGILSIFINKLSG